MYWIQVDMVYTVYSLLVDCVIDFIKDLKVIIIVEYSFFWNVIGIYNLCRL